MLQGSDGNTLQKCEVCALGLYNRKKVSELTSGLYSPSTGIWRLNRARVRSGWFWREMIALGVICGVEVGNALVGIRGV
jgi:hypothetical protein